MSPHLSAFLTLYGVSGRAGKVDLPPRQSEAPNFLPLGCSHCWATPLCGYLFPISSRGSHLDASLLIDDHRGPMLPILQGSPQAFPDASLFHLPKQRATQARILREHACLTNSLLLWVLRVLTCVPHQFPYVVIGRA